MKCLYASFLLSLVLVTSAYAQDFSENPVSNRDVNGKLIRSGYITNRWCDNWAISLGGGVNTMWAEENKMRISPDIEFGIAKWASPTLGFRAGIQGYQCREKFTPDFTNRTPLPYDEEKGIVYWDYVYAHADILWNASNTFRGYKYPRVYSFIPYFHSGYQRIFDPEDAKNNYDNEFVIGPGLLNNIRLTNAINLYIDLRVAAYSARFHENLKGGWALRMSATAGLSFNLPRDGWRRVDEIEAARDAALAGVSAAREAEKAALEAQKAVQDRLKDAEEALRRANEENDALRERNNGLEKQLEDSNKAAEAAAAAAALAAAENKGDELLTRIAVAGLVVYYDKNVDVLRGCEELHIDKYVRETLRKDSEHVFYITGSADKGTGTKDINARLCRGRVEGVKNYLINELGVPEKQIVVRPALITDRHKDNRIDRCVLFENE